MDFLDDCHHSAIHAAAEGNGIKVDEQITASRVDESRGEANVRGRI